MPDRVVEWELTPAMDTGSNGVQHSSRPKQDQGQSVEGCKQRLHEDDGTSIAVYLAMGWAATVAP
jgi:hypothetical protein